MAILRFTTALAAEYQRLFDSAVIRPEKAGYIETIVNTMIKNRARYEAIAADANCPWWVVACIHNMECSLSFSKHLHNGDPLTARTKLIPRGRPTKGTPPFSFEESALDALAYDGLNNTKSFSIPEILFKFESYNGVGYRLYHPDVLSPYLWAGTNHYTRGKYAGDGVWSQSLVSQQIGIATLMRRLAERGQIALEHTPEAAEDGLPVQWSGQPIQGEHKARALWLQNSLNQVPGIYIKPDGWPGDATSDAFKRVFGYYLQGDPRGSK